MRRLTGRSVGDVIAASFVLRLRVCGNVTHGWAARHARRIIAPCVDQLILELFYQEGGGVRGE